VTNGCKLLLLVLLVGTLRGFGQQPSSRLEKAVAAAQQAQAAHDYTAAADDYRQAVELQPGIAELWTNLGLMQQETGNMEASVRSLEQAHRLNPSLYVPNLFLGLAYTRTGQAKEAVPFLLRAEQENPRDPQAALGLGRAWFAQGDFPSAVRVLEHAVSLQPDLSSAWFALGIAELDQVEVEARRMTEQDADSPFARALYGESLEQQGRYREAGDLFRQLLPAPQQPPCLHSDLGYALLRFRDPSAGAELAQARAAHPECALALIGQARLAILAGSDDQSLLLLKDLWTSDPGYVLTNIPLLTDALEADRAAAWSSFLENHRAEMPDALYAALTRPTGKPASDAAPEAHTPASVPGPPASVLYKERKYRACGAQFSHELATYSSDQLQLLAACSYFAGDFRRTASSAAALLARQSRSVAARYWAVKADEKLAFRALDRFQQLEPNSARTHLLLGDIDRQRERFDDAVTEYRTALSIAPDDPSALLGLAYAYLSNNNIDLCIQTARTALARTPDDPELNLLMADALVSNHDFSRARPFLERSANVKPQMLPHLHALLGKADAASGDIPGAIRELKLGEASDDDGAIHYQLALLYRQMGDTKSATQALAATAAIKRERRDHKLIAVDDPDLTASASDP
jgi:Flp pilus assembly protein TadD